MDGVFDNADLEIMAAAKADSNRRYGARLWTEGDFNGDGQFDEADLVLAFSRGGLDGASE